MKKPSKRPIKQLLGFMYMASLYFLIENEGAWQGPFCFVQAADSQYGMMDNWDEKVPGGWEREIKLTRQAVAAANQMKPKPKFFIMCGDLVDAMPGNISQGKSGL